MLKTLTIVLSFLILIGTQGGAGATCDGIKTSLEKFLHRNDWHRLDMELQSSDIDTQIRAMIEFSSKLGYPFVRDLITRDFVLIIEYDEWLIKQSCGIHYDLRPHGSGMDKRHSLKSRSKVHNLVL